MKLNSACKSCGRSRVARVEPCHWSEGYVGVSLQGRRATAQVMLGSRDVTAGKMGRNSNRNFHGGKILRKPELRGTSKTKHLAISYSLRIPSHQQVDEYARAPRKISQVK